VHVAIDDAVLAYVESAGPMALRLRRFYAMRCAGFSAARDAAPHR
jgi:hypothetical protein